MNIRAKANGDVLDLPDDAARELVDAGIYEEVVADAPEAAKPVQTPKPKTVKTVKTPKEKKKSAREYKRRDMQAEK